MGDGEPQRVYNDGSVYTGEWSDEHLHRQGAGTINFSDSVIYRGKLAGGYCEGFGEAEIPAQSKNSPVHRYQGQFSRGKFHGLGVFTFNTGSKFEGEFKDGQIQGLGRFTFAPTDEVYSRLPYAKQCEGYFEQGRLTRREACQGVVDQAARAAAEAKSAAAAAASSAQSGTRVNVRL